ncbi:MAG: hypothetical protein ACREAC_30210, partial [Blastocatellia bacterium]
MKSRAFGRIIGLATLAICQIALTGSVSAQTAAPNIGARLLVATQNVRRGRTVSASLVLSI